METPSPSVVAATNASFVGMPGDKVKAAETSILVKMDEKDVKKQDEDENEEDDDDDDEDEEDEEEDEDDEDEELETSASTQLSQQPQLTTATTNESTRAPQASVPPPSASPESSSESVHPSHESVTTSQSIKQNSINSLASAKAGGGSLPPIGGSGSRPASIPNISSQRKVADPLVASIQSIQNSKGSLGSLKQQQEQQVNDDHETTAERAISTTAAASAQAVSKLSPETLSEKDGAAKNVSQKSSVNSSRHSLAQQPSSMKTASEDAEAINSPSSKQHSVRSSVARIPQQSARTSQGRSRNPF
jgi:hypothetical protein